MDEVDRLDTYRMRYSLAVLANKRTQGALRLMLTTGKPCKRVAYSSRVAELMISAMSKQSFHPLDQAICLAVCKRGHLHCPELLRIIQLVHAHHSLRRPAKPAECCIG